MINHRLRKIKGIPGLTDALVESDPAHVADWYLDFGAEAEEILELGMRSPDSAMTYNVNTIFTITEKLPFHDSFQLYDSDLRGKAHLEEILT